METMLNEMQKSIVFETQGPVMVLAGAGSGKTRVLTQRIAHLLNSGLANSSEILAITFTNKAANEIKNRLFLMNIDCYNIWAMTFHSMCAKILRFEAQNIDGYNSNFSIFDEQDKNAVIKKIMKEQNIKQDGLANEVSDKLSKFKMSNMDFEEYKRICCFTEHDKQVFDLMNRYEIKMKEQNAMDFDDLLIKTLLLLKTNQQVREKYQHKFRYILVDEFQDTSDTQYELVKILGAYHQNIFVVGDEDQNIYTWRGASVNNIKKFLQDFQSTKLFKLEQNYRSTKNIIDAANKIIKNNKSRIDKTLFTENETGTNVIYNKSFSDKDEADFVTKTIKNLVLSKGYEYKDIAVLMRLNAFTRNFEEKFVSYDVPYRIFGGQKFYERAEIKNVMAYFKLLVNPRDEESFYRIVNFPKRGIGDGAIDKLKERSFGTNLFDAVLSLSDEETGQLAKFIPFKNLMKDFLQKMTEKSLFDFAQYVIEKTNILAEYSNETDDEINRKLNIAELMQNIKNFEDDNPDKTLVDFLGLVSLSTDIDSFQDKDNLVTLATVHSVKGLEFKVVFVIGLEEKYFPIIRMNSDEDDIEEERRLMYVAVTRAKERLYLTCSKKRYLYGKESFSTVSRFVKELGYENEFQTYEQREPVYQPKHTTSFGGSLNSFMHKATQSKSFDFAVGDRVFHSNYGVGYISSIDKTTRTAKIDFDSFGNKILSIDFAPIKKL